MKIKALPASAIPIRLVCRSLMLYNQSVPVFAYGGKFSVISRLEGMDREDRSPETPVRAYFIKK